jgi:hypothetical protein
VRERPAIGGPGSGEGDSGDPSGGRLRRARAAEGWLLERFAMRRAHQIGDPSGQHMAGMPIITRCEVSGSVSRVCFRDLYSKHQAPGRGSRPSPYCRLLEPPMFYTTPKGPMSPGVGGRASGHHNESHCRMWNLDRDHCPGRLTPLIYMKINRAYDMHPLEPRLSPLPSPPLPSPLVNLPTPTVRTPEVHLLPRM